MTADPWASQDPWASNEDTGPASPWSTEEAPTEDNKESTVPDKTNSEIVVTLKQNGGYESPWLVVHAVDAADAERQLLEIKNGNLLRAISSVAGDFAATKAVPFQRQPSSSDGYVATQAHAPAQPQPQQQSRPQQNAPAWSDGRSCTHGVMVAREGTNKNGNPYKVYFCAAPQNTPEHEKCKAVWVK